MNTQLVDSLVQTILALPIAERTLLETKLSAAKPPDSVWTDEATETFPSLENDAPSQRQNLSTDPLAAFVGAVTHGTLTHAIDASLYD